MNKLEKVAKEIFINEPLPKEEYIEAIEISKHFEKNDTWRRLSLQVKGYSMLMLGLRKLAYNVFLTLSGETIEEFDFYDLSSEHIDRYFQDIKDSWNSIFSLEEKIKKSPENIKYLDELSSNYFTLGFIEKTAEYYQKILEIDKEDYEVWYYLAEIYDKLGRKEEAIECYKKVCMLIDENDDDFMGFRDGALSALSRLD